MKASTQEKHEERFNLQHWCWSCTTCYIGAYGSACLHPGKKKSGCVWLCCTLACCTALQGTQRLECTNCTCLLRKVHSSVNGCTELQSEHKPNYKLNKIKNKISTKKLNRSYTKIATKITDKITKLRMKSLTKSRMKLLTKLQRNYNGITNNYE